MRNENDPMANDPVDLFRSKLQEELGRWNPQVKQAHALIAPIYKFVEEMKDVIASENLVRSRIELAIGDPSDAGVPFDIQITAGEEYYSQTYRVYENRIFPRDDDNGNSILMCAISVEEVLHAAALLAAEVFAPLNAGR
jgi:hypothetical protein